MVIYESRISKIGERGGGRGVDGREEMECFGLFRGKEECIFLTDGGGKERERERECVVIYLYPSITYLGRTGRGREGGERGRKDAYF
jgi:hypothetical protein